jgi:hypothetical protein
MPAVPILPFFLPLVGRFDPSTPPCAGLFDPSGTESLQIFDPTIPFGVGSQAAMLFLATGLGLFFDVESCFLRFFGVTMESADGSGVTRHFALSGAQANSMEHPFGHGVPPETDCDAPL